MEVKYLAIMVEIQVLIHNINIRYIFLYLTFLPKNGYPVSKVTKIHKIKNTKERRRGPPPLFIILHFSQKENTSFDNFTFV